MRIKKLVRTTLSVVLCTGMIASSAAASSIGEEGEQVSYDSFLAFPDLSLKNEGPLVSGVNYLRNFAKDGMEGIEIVKGSGSAKVDSGKLVVDGQKGETIYLDKSGPAAEDIEAEFVFSPHNDNQGGLYGIVFRYQDEKNWTFIGQDGESGRDPELTSWVMKTADSEKTLLWTDGQRIYTRRNVPYTLKVRVVGNAVSLYLDNALVFSQEVEGMTSGAGQVGLLYADGSGADIQYLSIREAGTLKASEAEEESVSIASEELTVTMDKRFPRVIDYTLTDGERKIYGQETPVYVVEINNEQYIPEVTPVFSKEEASYHLSISDLGIAFDVVYAVKGNVLDMRIKNIQDELVPVKTISFPNQSMVSMHGDEPGGELRVNNYREETVTSLAEAKVQSGFYTTSLATLSGENVAASINNGSINNRQEIAYRTVENGSGTSTGLWTNEFQYRGLDNEVIEEPWCQVAVTGDRNGDGKIDFQDAAIARRDDIGTERIGSEQFADSFSMIAMDVGSIAQNPFLRILDNVKKFHASTDGFEQTILIKGYQSEGHDAAHPDYANISERAGGLEDFMVLLNEAGEYGAEVGVHINHTEIYPEAAQYDETIAADTDGWTWYDDSKHIIRENDLMNSDGGFDQRLEELDKLTEGRLDFIYVDTYQDSRWQAHKVMDKLKDLGIAVGTEYSEELIKESTWSHTLNAENIQYNTTGNLVRFVDNETKDIFPQSPLFRGLADRNNNAGFGGWQNCFSYNTTMEYFYTQVLPQKYLAHFPVQQWEKEDEAVLGYDSQVVTRLSEEVNQITKDGKLIADGNKIFIPWDPEEETKIYHYNEEGGETTWELPDSWEGETSVKLFTLTDEGRQNMQEIEVTDGTVTLNTDAKQGYVLYKGSADVENTDMTAYNWSEGSPVADMGFDSHTFGHAWEKESSSGSTDHIQYVDNALEGAAEMDAADNQNGNTHLHIQGGEDAVVFQTMKDLVPGQTYSVSVFAEGSEGRKLTLEVTDTDGNSYSNYSADSSVAYGAPHNDRFGSHYQRMKVVFTQPSDSTMATIRLIADKGEEDSWANFDNVRVVAVNPTDKGEHLCFEDFEAVDQEFGPFICPTKVTQSHLSERNGEWTKDVIDGRYSLKVRGNGDTEQKFNYMRTLPQTLRLEPNTTYKVGFDYMVTDVAANQEMMDKGDTVFAFGVKSDKALAEGNEEAASVASKEIAAADYEAHNSGEIVFTTGEYDDYYMDFLDETYAHEFIIDNFYVDVVEEAE